MIVLLPLEREKKKNHIQIGTFFKLIKWQIQILINSSSHTGDGGFLCQWAIEEDNYRGPVTQYSYLDQREGNWPLEARPERSKRDIDPWQSQLSRAV